MLKKLAVAASAVAALMIGGGAVSAAAEVTITAPAPVELAEGATGQVDVVVTNTGDDLLENITVTGANATCPATALPAGGQMTCTAELTGGALGTTVSDTVQVSGTWYDTVESAAVTVSNTSDVFGWVSAQIVTGQITACDPADTESEPISLLDADGNQVQQVYADADGSYTFDPVPAGAYTVSVFGQSVPVAEPATSFENPVGTVTVNVVQEGCPEPPPVVNPVEPASTCDTVTIPNREGVFYQDGNGDLVSGTITLADGESVTITAVAAAGYALPDGDWTWTYTESCAPTTTAPAPTTTTPAPVTVPTTQAPAAPQPTVPPTLPKAGGGTSVAIWFALLTAGIGATGMIARRRKEVTVTN